MLPLVARLRDRQLINQRIVNPLPLPSGGECQPDRADATSTGWRHIASDPSVHEGSLLERIVITPAVTPVRDL
jgi:hypothetical protein